jgi:hypothetical protein
MISVVAALLNCQPWITNQEGPKETIFSKRAAVSPKVFYLRNMTKGLRTDISLGQYARCMAKMVDQTTQVTYQDLPPHQAFFVLSFVSQGEEPC